MRAVGNAAMWSEGQTYVRLADDVERTYVIDSEQVRGLDRVVKMVKRWRKEHGQAAG